MPEGKKDFLGNLRERFRKIEETENTYLYPLPQGMVFKERIQKKSPAHTGAFRGAIDFMVDLGTPVLCSLEGDVTKVVDTNDKFGPTKNYKDDLNFVTVRHSNGEYSQYAHLAKDSVTIKEGDHVVAGQQIAVTGNSGWMTKPHLHFFVFKGSGEPPGFVGLKVRFKK